MLTGLTTGERLDLKAGQGSLEVIEKLKQTLKSSGTRYYFYHMRALSTIKNGLALTLQEDGRYLAITHVPNKNRVNVVKELTQE